MILQMVFYYYLLIQTLKSIENNIFRLINFINIKLTKKNWKK